MPLAASGSLQQGGVGRGRHLRSDSIATPSLKSYFVAACCFVSLAFKVRNFANSTPT